MSMSETAFAMSQIVSFVLLLIQKIVGSGAAGTLSESEHQAKAHEKHSLLIDRYRKFLNQSVEFYQDVAQKLQERFSGMLANDGSNNDIVPQCFKCYVCLGDLTRYSLITVHDNLKAIDWTGSFDYYRQAAILRPTVGNPYNQLAVLAVYVEDPNLGMYYYFRSLALECPFKTAKSNLTLLFENNRLTYIDRMKEHMHEKQRQNNSKSNKNNNNNNNKKRSRKKHQKTDGNRVSIDLSSGAVDSKKETDYTVLQMFRMSFVRLHGINFTLTDMETYQTVLDHFLACMESVMKSHACLENFSGIKSDSIEKDCSMSFRCVVCNIFAVHNVGESDRNQNQTETDSVRSSVFYRNAFCLAFAFATKITKHVLKSSDNKNYKARGKAIFESVLMPSIIVMLEWLSHQPKFVNPDNISVRHDSTEKDIRDEYWKVTVKLLNCAIDFGYEDWMESSLLPHDNHLRGFGPMIKVYRTLEVVRRKHNNYRHPHDDRQKVMHSIRAGRCANAGRIIAENTSACPLIFDDKKGRFFIKTDLTKEQNSSSSQFVDITGAGESTEDVDIEDDDDEEIIVYKPTRQVESFDIPRDSFKVVEKDKSVSARPSELVETETLVAKSKSLCTEKPLEEGTHLMGSESKTFMEQEEQQRQMVHDLLQEPENVMNIAQVKDEGNKNAVLLMGKPHHLDTSKSRRSQQYGMFPHMQGINQNAVEAFNGAVHSSGVDNNIINGVEKPNDNQNKTNVNSRIPFPHSLGGTGFPLAQPVPNSNSFLPDPYKGHIDHHGSEELRNEHQPSTRAMASLESDIDYHQQRPTPNPLLQKIPRLHHDPQANRPPSVENQGTLPVERKLFEDQSETTSTEDDEFEDYKNQISYNPFRPVSRQEFVDSLPSRELIMANPLPKFFHYNPFINECDEAMNL